MKEYSSRLAFANDMAFGDLDKIRNMEFCTTPILFCLLSPMLFPAFYAQSFDLLDKVEKNEKNIYRINY